MATGTSQTGQSSGIGSTSAEVSAVGTKVDGVSTQITALQTSDKHIPKFGGELWHVNAAMSSSGDGTTPDTAFKTIGEAITACAAGDAITIMAGTYTETGIDLNKNNVEMWFEIGAVIAPASGTALTLSANECKIKGMHRITPAAGETGLLISGNFCHAEHGMIQMAGIGMLITGTGAMVNNYAVGFPTISAYDIQGGQARLTACNTAGNAATYGYYINSGADTGVLSDCTSVGHQTAGYFIDSGSSNWTVVNCSSGAQDGKWRDIDSTNVWSKFSYPETKYKGITFTTTGAQTYNLFRVYGTVLIHTINAHVETTICDNLTLPKLETWDGTAAIEITDDDGGALTDLPVGSYIIKSGKVADGLEVFDASAASVGDEWDAKKAAFSVTAKAGVATYIRFNCTSTTTPPTGALHWHVEWEPKTDDGFLEEA